MSARLQPPRAFADALAAQARRAEQAEARVAQLQRLADRQAARIRELEAYRERLTRRLGRAAVGAETVRRHWQEKAARRQAGRQRGRAA